MPEHPTLEDIALFVYGQLPDPKPIEDHIDECADCAAEVILGREMRYTESLGLIDRSTPSGSTDQQGGNDFTESAGRDVTNQPVPSSKNEGGKRRGLSAKQDMTLPSARTITKAPVARRVPASWFAIAAVVLLLLSGGLIVTIGLAMRSTRDLAAARSEVNGLRAELRRLKSGEEVALAPGIEFHVDKSARTPARAEIWEANYQPNDPPAESLRRIYTASDGEVKEFIDQMRESKKPDFEILTAVKLRFGPPEAKP